MPLNLNKVTEFAAVQGTAQIQLVAEHHFIRLKGAEAESALYIQGGRVYGEGGPEIDAGELPEWFDVELSKCSPQALAAVGWGPIGEPGNPRRR